MILPTFSWNDLATLQVSIQSLPSSGDVPAVYLDSVWINVDYVALSPSPSPSPDDEVPLVPFLHKPEMDQSGTRITVPVSLSSITDIDGCTQDTCKFWQMHFQRLTGNGAYNAYYSSDVYPAAQLDASYTFDLPPGTYTAFFVAGYQGSATGTCKWFNPEINEDGCPDGKHDITPGMGLRVIDNPGFLTYPFTIPYAPQATSTGL